MSKPRFELYVKAASDGKTVGDCPFSMRANMYAHLKIPRDQFTVTPVDIINKTEEFLKMNPEGKVPVLVDKETATVIADSAAITAYIHKLFPEPDLHQDYSGPAVQASAGVFGKLAALLKNKDVASVAGLREDLEKELQILDDFLSCAEHTGKFLICDTLCELDCSLIPKLRHLQVAGRHFHGFEIPTKCTTLLKYIKQAEESDVFKVTCMKDEEIIHGWSRHDIMMMKS